MSQAITEERLSPLNSTATPFLFGGSDILTQDLNKFRFARTG